MRRLHLRIQGRVQGVAFRAYTTREARNLGLSGWVRNLYDGTVELLAEGEEAPLKALEAWCHHGPPSAAVSSVEAQWLEFIGDLEPFGIRYS